MDPVEEADLGKLAVLQGWCTAAQVDECRRLQSSSRSPALLGDLLLFKGYLTAPRLEGLRNGRRRKTMACPRCALSYAVFTRSDGRSARCPRCGGTLAERAEGPSAPGGGTITPRRVPVPPAGPAAPRGGRNVTMVCVLCDSEFGWAPDASGRARCPTCGGTFPAKHRTG